MANKTVAIIDYGMGNLRSVYQAFKHVSNTEDIVVTSDPKVVASADRIVFPGQGAMPDCMRELEEKGLKDPVLSAAQQKPFLGICIGLQMLFDFSEEGNVPGLGILKGQVKHFPMPQMHEQGLKLKVPHMGWNQVSQKKAHPLWQNIDDAARFYFVHSYYIEPDDKTISAASTHYGIDFTAAVAQDNIFAIQCHPEKSAQTGLQLLENFLSWQP